MSRALSVTEGQIDHSVVTIEKHFFKLLLRNWSYNYIMHTQNTNLQVRFLLLLKCGFLLHSFFFQRRQMLILVNTSITTHWTFLLPVLLNCCRKWGSHCWFMWRCTFLTKWSNPFIVEVLCSIFFKIFVQ